MDDKMPNNGGAAPALSTRGGAAVMRGISLFLVNGKLGRQQQSADRPRASRKAMTGKVSTQKCSPKIVEIVKRDTNLTRFEIEMLYKIYKKLVEMNRKKIRQSKQVKTSIGKPTTVQEGVDRMVFCELLHNTFDIITEDALMDRIFCVWDKGNLGLLTPEAWLFGMAVFLKGSLQEKIHFCFTVYDLNNDGYITKDEMFNLLKNCLIKQPQEEDSEESVKDLVEIVLRKLDKDKDGKISLEDYQTSVYEEPLLIEAFGNCLPSERAKLTFLSTMHV